MGGYGGRGVPMGAPMGGGGPSMMGMMGASMAGSLAGNALAHSMMGGHHHGDAAPPAPAPVDTTYAQQAAAGAGVCGPQFEAYAKCVEANGGNVNACLWAWDMVAQCRANHGVA